MTVTAAADVQTTFYSDRLCTTELDSRTDTRISFDWAYGSPQAGVPVDNFAIRFQAWFTPPTNGNYRFATVSDDGVILFVDGIPRIHNWTLHGPTEDVSELLTLTTGTPRRLELFFFEGVGGAVIELYLRPEGGTNTAIGAGCFALPDGSFEAVDFSRHNFTDYDSAGNIVIYDDALGANWHNWSFAVVDLAHSENTYSGTCAIKMDLDGWGAFCPFFDNGQNWAGDEYRGLSTRGFDTLSFKVHRGDSGGGQTVGVQSSDLLPGAWEWQHRTAFTVPTNDAWQEVNIPLTDIDSVDTRLTRLAWVGNGHETDAILLDDIRLLRDASPAVVTRQEMVNTNGLLWLYRDERDVRLGTSWNADMVRQDTASANGPFCLSTRFSHYGSVQFRPADYDWADPPPFDLSGGANYLKFLVNRGANDATSQVYHVYAYDRNEQAAFKAPIEDYIDSGVFDLDPNTWQEVAVPVYRLLAGGNGIYAVGVQEMSGIEGVTLDDFLLDDVRFLYQTPSADCVIYDDALGAGWNAGGSWDTDYVPDSAAPVHSGSAALAVTHTAAWGGLYLHNDAPLDTRDYRTLRFWLHGGAAGGQSIKVWLHAADYVAGTPVTLDAPAAGTGTVVDVSFEELGAPTRIRAVAWQDAAGSAQGTYYLDRIVLVADTPAPPPPQNGPALTIDVASNRRAINPHIYGINFASETLAAELNLPLRRYGGNAATRYNWQLDVSNRGSDWYFENIPNTVADEGALPDGSASDQFIEQDRRTGTRSLLTVPLIGWTPKDREYRGGFSVAKYGTQQSVDPWRPDCGNGKDTNGNHIAGNDPTDTSVAIDTNFVQDFMAHLSNRYDTGFFYSLDNEPMLWHHTHRDVHSDYVGYDELRDLTYEYAAAVKAKDPSAATFGPTVWGWTAYFYSALDSAPGGAWWNDPQDRNNHGGTPLVPWYLQQMRDYETAHGTRILDYLDLHYYPQADGVALAPAGNGDTRDRRLRSTRSLWDPTYTDESWIAEPVRLIPRMREWVVTNYPGTKLALTEYNWGALDHINGALAQADVLGIFGREGLDVAALWSPPDPGDPGAYAFRMYRNYDGDGAAFGDVGVSAASADQGQLAVYAALRTADSALTVMNVNKTDDTLTSLVSLEGFNASGVAWVYRYSATNANAIVTPADIIFSGASFDATFPPESITLLVLPPARDSGTVFMIR